MNDSQDELNVRLANKMKNNQQQKLEKIKSLSQNNFYTILFFDCHCSDICVYTEPVCLFFLLEGGSVMGCVC